MKPVKKSSKVFKFKPKNCPKCKQTLSVGNSRLGKVYYCTDHGIIFVED
jgi:hypothetical protein